MLGFIIKEWVTRDDIGDPTYVLPDAEIHSRIGLLEDFGINLFSREVSSEKEIIDHAPYAVLSTHLKDRMRS
jgi:hypothetical protein